MAAVAEGSTNDRSDTEEIDKEHDEKAGDAEIHSETNELVDVENDTSSEPPDNSSKSGQEDRTEKDPQGKEKSKMSSPGNEETEIDKDIVITGEPKLNGRVHIDTNLYFEHRQKNARNESSKNTTVTRPAYSEEKPDKSQLIGTVGHVVSSESTHAQNHKAYHDYEVAHKVLSKNIEKLKNVLEAIEDTHKTKNTGYSNRKFNRDEGIVQQKLLFNDRKATNSLKLANHSDQHTIKNGSLLSHTRSLGLKEQPLSSKDSIGLHVVEGNGNQTVDIRSQASSDIVDRIANDLVRHGVTSEPNGSSVNQWVNGLPYHNNTLQETLKELKPDDTNIRELISLAVYHVRVLPQNEGVTVTDVHFSARESYAVCPRFNSRSVPDNLQCGPRNCRLLSTCTCEHSPLCFTTFCVLTGVNLISSSPI